MRSKKRTFTASRLLTALLLVVATMVAPLHTVAHAQVGGGSGATTSAPDQAGGGSGDEIQRWWGALGAALCGLEARLIRVAPHIGMNPYAIAAGLSGCILALMDIMTTE